MAITAAVDLTSEQQEVVRMLLSQHLPDTEAWIYGSRVRWTSRPSSDLDMVVFATENQELSVSKLREAFEESDLPFRVDLFNWNDLSDFFKEQIERCYVVFVGKSCSSAKFQTIPLKELVQLTLSNVDKKVRKGEVSVLLCNYMDVYSRQFIRSDIPFMEATAKEREIERCGLRNEDVVITKDSEKHDDIGVPALVQEDVKGLVCGYHLAILRSLKDRLYGPYLFYALQTDDARRQFHSFANGITRFGLRKDDILRVVIPLPSLPDQRAIAQILSVIDNQIELNLRKNKTIEAMFRAIFKDWFVDYGPVRAKMQGRVTYLDTELWGLFPDALDNEERPLGWSLGAVADFAQSVRCNVSSSDISDNIPYIGLEHMPRRSIALSEWGKSGTVKSNKTHFNSGDILFGKLRPYFHKVGIAPLDGICSTDIVVVVPHSQEWAAFALACLSSDEFVDYTDRTSTGTKMPRTSWKTMAQFKVCLPSERVVSAFQSIVQPLLDHLETNIHEISTLAQTRDLLLPKLISGGLRIS